ncbi:MAG TPA: hypothetical protein PLW09_16190, partial [Candidatus Kapabacteria bacterium]|nr:hypothetical protein [Candidatus Kapabacteria bacterium]
SRIVIPFSGDYDEFRHVIYHEIIHSYLNKYYQENNSFWTSSIWGANLLPYWLNEGIADYFSKDGGMEYETDMFMRSYLYGSKSVDPNYLYGYPAYRYGEAFCNWVNLRYGDDKISMLIKEYAEKSTIKAKYYNVFNLGYESITRAFQDELKKIYNEEADKFQLPDAFGDIVKRGKVTSNYYTTNPQISPDGKKIIYIGNDNDDLGIYIHEIGSPKKNKILIDGWSTMGFQELVVSKHTVSWHPSSEKFVFTAKSNGYDQLYIYNTKTGDYEERYLNFRSVQSTHWSPDGNSLVISALKNNQQDIFIYSLNDNSIIQCTNDLYYDQSAVWSSDGKSVYFLSSREKSTSGVNSEKEDFFSIKKFNGVFNYSLSKKSLTQITDLYPFRITRILATKSDSSLFIIHDKNGINNIYRYNIASRSEKPVSNTRYAIKDISLSFNNEKMAFSAYNGTSTDLFVLDNPLTKKHESDTLSHTKFKLFKSNPNRFPLFSKDSSVKISSKSTEIFAMNQKKVDSMNMRMLKRYPINNESEFSNPLVYDDYNIYVGFNNYSFTPTLNGTLTLRDLFRDKYIYTYLTIGAPALNHFTDSSAPSVMYRASLYYEMKDFIIDYTFRLYRNSYIFPNYTETGVYVEGEYVLDQKQKLQLSTFILSADKPTQGGVFVSPTLSYTYDTRERASFSSYSGNYFYTDLELSPAIGKYGANFGLWTITARSDHSVGTNSSIGFAIDAGTSFGSAPPMFRVGGSTGQFLPDFSTPATNRNDNITEQDLFPTLQDAAFHQRYPVRGFPVNDVVNRNFITGSVYFKMPLIYSLPTTIFYDIGTAFNSFDDIAVGKKTVLQSTGISVEVNIFGFLLRNDIVYTLNSQSSYDSSFGLILAYGTYF